MQTKYISPPSANPPTLFRKTLTLITTAALAVVALMFSAMLLVVILIVVVFGGAYLWWKTRELRKQMQNLAPSPHSATVRSDVFAGEAFTGEVIEGEVVRMDEARAVGRRWARSIAANGVSITFVSPTNKVKLADKPGSVVDSHSSRRFVTWRSSNLPADDASNVIVSLFDLAPDGVYPAADVATSAVSSYLAISTLPDPFSIFTGAFAPVLLEKTLPLLRAAKSGHRRCIFCGTFHRLTASGR